MTLNRRILKRLNSPSSPKLVNTSIRRRTLLKRLSSGAVHFGASSKANLKVVVRVRPENHREIESNGRSVVDVVDKHMLVFDPKHEENDFFFQGTKQRFRDLSKKAHKEQKFMFEKIFDQSSTNEEIFETTTKDIVDTILNGYNCSVFAYGATGSGKTYTMLGTEGCPGITFMTVMELYKKIKEMEESKTCEVGVSYLEVYNEMVRDLLVPGKPLNLHESGQHIQVTGLSLHKPKDADELLRILAEGNRNRSQHPTDANSESSRSHAVFQVFVRQQNRTSDLTSGVSIAKLSMIDLAGSERGAVTGFKGARFREGANINKSLLALGNCINALADGKSHIPYRDSKLTRLLKDSIGGNCRSVMIATITRSSLSFEDTYNTLRYANRAKTIKTTIKKNFMNVDQHVSQYLKIVEDLKDELTVLKDRLKKYEEESPSASTDLAVSPDEKRTYEETILGLKKQLEVKGQKTAKQNAVEEEFLNRLKDLNCELKSSQREYLQLETTERELEKSIYSNRLQVVRMSVFVFASSRLEKGISKSERSLQSLRNRLEYVVKQKTVLKEKFLTVKRRILDLCEEYKKHFSEENLTPNPILKLNEMEMEQNLRDVLQVGEYYKSLVNSLLKDQSNTEKLLALLLIANKHFYLKLKSVKACDSETDELLAKIFEKLDSSRIEWADLKNTEDSFGEQSISNYLTMIPAIDAEKLTKFTLPNSYNFSPAVNNVYKMYKCSNIMKTFTAPETVPVPPPSILSDAESSTPVLSKKFLSLNTTPLSSPEDVAETSLGVEALPAESLSGDSITSDNMTPKTPIISEAESLTSAEPPTSPRKFFDSSPFQLPSNPCNNTTIAKDSPCDDLNTITSGSANDTFSLSSPTANSTFCVAENPTESDRPKFHDPPTPRNTFKKPTFSITPAKQSFSKLPSTFSKASSTGKSFRRSTSVSSLLNGVKATHGYSTSNKENSLKKSTSFVTSKCSSAKSKGVAFGSSFSNTQKPEQSKRSLTYLLPLPHKK